MFHFFLNHLQDTHSVFSVDLILFLRWRFINDSAQSIFKNDMHPAKFIRVAANFHTPSKKKSPPPTIPSGHWVGVVFFFLAGPVEI